MIIEEISYLGLTLTSKKIDGRIIYNKSLSN